MNLHGTRRRYIHGPDINNQPGRGCRCEHCRTADRRGRKLHHLAVIRGQARPEVDAQPIRTHLQVLCAAGMTRQAIARQAGVAHSLLSRLIHGDARTGQTVKTVRAKNADAILAVQATPAGELLIPATGTRRRLQSLAWRGWPRAIVAAHTGLAQQHLWRLTASNSTTRVSASTAIRVAQASRYLHLITPELAGVHPRQAALTRKRALAAGWLSLMAWDDLDDPDAVPDLGRRVTRDEALLEDSEELIGQGYTMEQAAERLGVNRKYLSTVRSRGRKSGRAVTADV